MAGTANNTLVFTSLSNVFLEPTWLDPLNVMTVNIMAKNAVSQKHVEINKLVVAEDEHEKVMMSNVHLATMILMIVVHLKSEPAPP
jgi:hypothetical protein